MLSVSEAVSELVICRISKQAGSVNGGDQVFIFTEKIQKGGSQVFYCYAIPLLESLPRFSRIGLGLSSHWNLIHFRAIEVENIT